jgi:peptidoglycan/xylan/chitin deacetylase (PgdA/CDA1 family)
MKRLLRRLAYRFGLLGIYHRLLNSGNLTVVIFHRVLPESDARWDTAELPYTMSAKHFEECLLFFKRHYTVVGLADIAQAHQFGRPLPSRPLLVTFDDGWLDNLTTALPILASHEIPAVVFVAVDAISDPREAWWQDVVVHGWNSGTLSHASFASFRSDLGLSGSQGEPWREGTTILDVLVAAAQLDPNTRDKHLDPLERKGKFFPPRQMLDAETLARLSNHRLIDIGSHGFSHLPLTHVSNSFAELEKSQLRLETLCGCKIASFSFPHGRYNGAHLKEAFHAGYKYLFTSDAILNDLRQGSAAVFGRIGIPGSEIVDHGSDFAPDRLATWLFTRKSGSSA